MQEGYIATREGRFSRMFDIIGAGLPARFRALDLGCGPGSLSVRLLRRFPSARVVAIDHDPLMLALGRAGYGTFNGRLTWVDADLRKEGWSRHIPQARGFDAVVSTTALHWLTPTRLGWVYREARSVLRRGGILLNGDKAPIDGRVKSLAERCERALQDSQHAYSQEHPSEGWETWWANIERMPSMTELLAERKRRYGSESHHEDALPASGHLARLRRAGFREAEVLWRDLSNVVIVALK